MLDASCQMLGRLSLCEVSRMSVDNYTNAVKLEVGVQLMCGEGGHVSGWQYQRGALYLHAGDFSVDTIISSGCQHTARMAPAEPSTGRAGEAILPEGHSACMVGHHKPVTSWYCCQGGVLGQLEDAADLAKLAQTCARMHALVTGTQWPQVRKLRLWRWTPSKPLASSWLSQRLTGLLELDVSGCHHLTDKDLACFSQLNLKVGNGCAMRLLQVMYCPVRSLRCACIWVQILRLNGCRGLFHTNTPYKLIQAMSRNAEEQGLEVLDLCNTRCVADVRLSISLGPALRELYLSPTWCSAHMPFLRFI